MDRARAAARRANPGLADDIRNFQFRDLRAKVATDTDEQQGIAAAQTQLGHSTSAMTRRYVRHRNGKLVKPTKQAEAFLRKNPFLRKKQDAILWQA